MAYIYKITNELNNKSYIGKTEYSDPEKRFQQHCSDRSRFPERPLYRAMNKHGIEYFSFEIIEETEEPEEREIYWIQHHNSYGSTGYNATLGGDGKRYLDHEKIIADYLKIKNISEVARMNNCHFDTVSKILNCAQIDKDYGPEVTGRKKRKKVAQYSKEGELLSTFPTIGTAAEHLGNVEKRRHISEVCNGKRKTAYGYVWKFVEE